MGWYGKYIYNASFKDIRNYIEEDTGLTVKSLKFGYAVAIYDFAACGRAKNPQPELLNMLAVVFWRKSKNEIMIKTITEDMGPCELDIPLKYVKISCKATENSKYAQEWRKNVIEYHENRKNAMKIAKNLSKGEHFFVHGNLYRYVRLYRNNKEIIAYNCEKGLDYRIKPWQVSMVK